MIVFENENELYTKLAQSYLETYISIYAELNKTIEEQEISFRSFFPPLVFLENKEKCIFTFLKIGEWARDKFYHKLGALEKYVIYHILNEIDKEVSTLGPKSFCEIYFKRTFKVIINILKEYHKEILSNFENENGKPFSNKEVFNFFISSDFFSEILFEDFDEGYIDLFFDGNDENSILIDDYFYDILPNDIVNSIKRNKKVLDCSVDDFLDSFKTLIEKSYYRICGFESYQEKDFQVLFEFYARSYNKISLKFDKVYREVEIGNGRVDFIINFPFSGDVLFELKMDRNQNVKQSILFQIPEYLENTKKDKAIIIIFSDENDNSQYLKFCENVYRDKQKNIYPFMINISKQLNPSKKKS